MPIAAVVYNPVKVDLDALKQSVAAAESDAGWDTTIWLETSVEDPGVGMAREATSRGVDVVMAAGGDGTIRAVAEGLRGSDTPIGLLPAGTGNLLARNLNLTLNQLDESVRTAFGDGERAIDLGVVDIERAGGDREKRVFLVMAGLGIDAQMIANTNPDLKKRLGWLAYVDAIIRVLKGDNRVRMRFSVDGGSTRSISVNTILIGNCGSLPANILLLPEAVVDDGIFDIVALRPEGFIGWLQIWTKIVWENGVLRRSQVGRKLMGLTKEVRTLRYLKGKEVIMRLDEPQEFQLDGDAFGEASAIRARIEAGGLKVKVPAEAAA